MGGPPAPVPNGGHAARPGLELYLARFRAEGLTFVQEPPPVGRGFTVRHPGDTVIEYVYHRPTSAERY